MIFKLWEHILFTILFTIFVNSYQVPGRERRRGERWLEFGALVLRLKVLRLRARGHDPRLALKAEPTEPAVPARRARRLLQRARCEYLQVVVRPEYVRDQQNGPRLACNAGCTRGGHERTPTGLFGNCGGLRET